MVSALSVELMSVLAGMLVVPVDGAPVIPLGIVADQLMLAPEVGVESDTEDIVDPEQMF